MNYGYEEIVAAQQPNKVWTSHNQAEQFDSVNHPKHYNSHPSGIEAITIAEHFSFCLGNVVKYIFRAGLKENNTTLVDLKKAKFYLDREIERLSKQ